MNTTFIFKNMAEVADEAKVHPSWNDYPELEAELEELKEIVNILK